MPAETAWPACHVPETTGREGYTSAEVAERLTEGGSLDREHLLARFRGFVRHNYITPTGLYVGDKKDVSQRNHGSLRRGRAWSPLRRRVQ